MRTPNANSAPVAAQASRYLSLGAAMILTAHAEHELAVAVGINSLLAWLFPVALDLYAAAAFRAHARRDIGAAIGLMIACQTLAHLLAAGMIAPAWWLVIPVSAVVPVVLWRGHHLGNIPKAAADPVPTPAAPVAQPQPAPVPPPPASATEPTPAPALPRPAGRPAADRLTQVAELISARPSITQADAARLLRITDRQLRNIVPTGWRTYKASVLATV